MKLACVLSHAVVAALVMGATAAAQMPPAPKPGPEHDVLKMDLGTWDAVVEVMAGPGAAPTKSTGVETNTLGCGGRCLITDFKGEMMPGQPFEGHGVTAYDPGKKKYVGSWTDSMSVGLSIAETTFDPATKKSTGWMEGPDMSGNVSRMKATGEYTDADHRVFTMYAPGTTGNEAPTMRITYTRRK